jgi:nucleoid-associated protein YgaU
VGYSGTQHRTNYVRIKWGRLALMRFDPDVFDGSLKSAQIQYKMFKSDGTPLRAIITATFTEAISDEAAESRDNNSSPDLTHVRRVKEGDTLPALTREIYGDFRYYLEVARANQLSNFRQLTPGDTIFFPPLATNTKKTAL